MTDSHLDGYFIEVAKKYSIAQARDSLARLVHEAESGQVVHLTRRGEPVAVVVSTADYARLRGEPTSFWERLEGFREQHHDEDLHDALSVGSLRDPSPGREPGIP